MFVSLISYHKFMISSTPDAAISCLCPLCRCNLITGCAYDQKKLLPDSSLMTQYVFFYSLSVNLYIFGYFKI